MERDGERENENEQSIKRDRGRENERNIKNVREIDR